MQTPSAGYKNFQKKINILYPDIVKPMIRTKVIQEEKAERDKKSEGDRKYSV